MLEWKLSLKLGPLSPYALHKPNQQRLGTCAIWNRALSPRRLDLALSNATYWQPQRLLLQSLETCEHEAYLRPLAASRRA